MTRGSLLGRDSETRSVLAWTVCGAWSARCRCLPRTVCRSRVQTSWPAQAPHSHLLSTDREQQQQHILMPAAARAAPAQLHAHYCSICGAARHNHRETHAHTRTHAHTYIHPHACACAHTYKHKRVRVYTQAHTHIHMHMHRYTRAHTYKRPNTQAHTRAHTHTHTCICSTRCAHDGFRQFFSVASDAPSLVLIHFVIRRM